MKHSRAAELFPVHVQQHIDRKVQNAGGANAFPDGAILDDQTYSHVTTDALRAALSEFQLALQPGVDCDWLANAVRCAFTCSTPYSALFEDYQGNTNTRDNLLTLAKRSLELANNLGDLGGEELRVINSVFNNESKAVLTKTISQLVFLGESLEIIAGGLKVEQGKWKSSAARELRIRQAYYLSPIFVAAFGRDATVNDRPGANDLGPWARFFSLVAEVATEEPVASLRDVLKEARKRHKANPIQW